MFNRLRTYFLSGLVVFLPLALTIYLFFLAITTAENVLGKYLRPYFGDYFGFYIPGLGIIVGIYLIVLIGFLATNFLGQRIYDWFEKLLVKLPFFRQVYPAIKEMAMFLFSRERLKQFKHVVLIEYPRKGIYSFGFLTNDASKAICEQTKQDLCNVFIPSAPGPLTGFAVMIPRKDITLTDIKIEDAFKFILSGGVVNPLR